MLRGIRITPATAIAIIALVFAATGGAFAATGGGGSSAPGASASAAKHKTKTGPRGPAGPAGKQGALGPAGPAGAQGPAGAKGEPGAKGETGARGETGPEGPEGPEGEHGKTGPQGNTGPQGPQGVPGEPWTPNNVLPSGATETGTWGGRPSENGGHVISTISFPVALASELDQAHAQLVPDEPEATGTGNLESNKTVVTGVTATTGEFKVGARIEDTTHPAAIPPGTKITNVEPGEFTMSADATASASGDSLKAGNPAGCPAGASAKKPAAEKGNLCVYIGENILGHGLVSNPYKPYEVLVEGAGTAGALIDIEGGANPNLVWGSWAVTAE